MRPMTATLIVTIVALGLYGTQLQVTNIALQGRISGLERTKVGCLASEEAIYKE